MRSKLVQLIKAMTQFVLPVGNSKYYVRVCYRMTCVCIKLL